MDRLRGIVLALCIAAAFTAACPPCHAGQKNDGTNTLFDEAEDRGQRRRRGLELSDEEINRILDALKKRDPKKAREVESLRKEDPERFMDELRRHAQEEYGKVIAERIERWRQRRREEFIAFLKENAPQEAEELAACKDKNPDLYTRKYDLAQRKYRRAFEESNSNPELTQIILEDLKLQKRRDDLVAKIRRAKNESDKERLTMQLHAVLSDRYDLIVRRKQLAYEQLLKRLEAIQNSIHKASEEIREAQKDEVKARNIEDRQKTLLEGKKGFDWD